jgi:hypothetical protein
MNGRNIVIIILLVGLLVGAAAIYTLARPTPTQTTSEEIRAAYTAYLKNLESQNLTALVSEYEVNGTITTFGASLAPLGGPEALLQGGTIITNPTNIRIIYGQLFLPDNFGTSNLTNISSKVFLNETRAVVNSTISMQGNETYSINSTSDATGKYTASVILSISYASVDDTWLIASEYWDWTSFHICGPVSTYSVPQC